MANHKSTLKRIRSNQTSRLRNKYYSKSMRNAIRGFLSIEDKAEAEKSLPQIISMVDKMAKRNVIHKNKAGNLKSRVARHIQSMA